MPDVQGGGGGIYSNVCPHSFLAEKQHKIFTFPERRSARPLVCTYLGARNQTQLFGLYSPYSSGYSRYPFHAGLRGLRSFQASLRWKRFAFGSE